MLYTGYELRIGETKWIIPPLSLGQLRKGALDMLRKHDELIEAGKIFDANCVRGDLILFAVRRNYPDITEGEENSILDFLDLNTTNPIWLSVLGLSGFTPGETNGAEKTETQAPTPGISAPSIAA